MKQVIYFETYRYCETLNYLIGKLETEEIKVIDVVIGVRQFKYGDSKITHTLIVESDKEIEVHTRVDKLDDDVNITISIYGDDIIEF